MSPKYTQKQLDFIGSEFHTPKGGLLTVIGINSVVCTQGKSRKRYTCKYNVECSVCSNDSELFPEGSIISSRPDLIRGSIPCGCATNPRWEEWQNKIRVQRLCSERGYIFNGWHGEYKGCKTYLDLYNPYSNNNWTTTTMYNFMTGYGDPKGFREPRKITTKLYDDTDDIHLGKVFNNKGSDSYITLEECIRVENKAGYKVKLYISSCSVCSKDEDLWPYGSIVCRLGDLGKGQIPCGCSKHPYMKPFQRDILSKRACLKENLTFVKWDTVSGEYESSKSFFLWLCKEGHENRTKYAKFMAGDRCATCRKNLSIINGYMKDRVDEKDHLYLLVIDGSYLKLGRAINMKNRLRFIKGKHQAQTKDVVTIKVYTGLHGVIYDIEQRLLEKFESLGYKHYTNWTSETLKLEFKNEILQELSTLNLEEVK